jgi:hypothetical protein
VKNQIWNIERVIAIGCVEGISASDRMELNVCLTVLNFIQEIGSPEELEKKLAPMLSKGRATRKYRKKMRDYEKEIQEAA